MTETAPDVRRRYEDTGYVIFREAIDGQLVAEAYDHVDWLLRRNPDLRPEQLSGLELAADDPFWIRLVSDDRLLDIAEHFVGPDIALFATHYICKPPKTGLPVRWHQDGAFWPLEPMDVITLWLSVTDSGPENGCLRVIPGTNKLELKGLRVRDDVDNVLSAEMDDDGIDESAAVDLVLRPGDVSVHHPNIVHGSEPNTSERWRRALTIRYIATSTKITEQEAACPFLLRGRAVDGVNTYLDRPTFREGAHMPFSRDASWRQKRPETPAGSETN